VSWRLEEVVRATGAEVLRRGAASTFSAIATDSRTLGGGELFVALRGPRYDAHRFVAEAVAAGAHGLIVEHDVDLDHATYPAVLAVRDTLGALQDLAAMHRRRHAPCVFGITGSNGKTTTKEMLAEILAAAGGAGAVLKTDVNLNNVIGVPLTLLRLTGRERYAVVEMGMNAPGEIWRLAEIADPEVGVITNVGPAHLAGVGSLAGVARAKGELFARMRSSAVAVANADDPCVVALAEEFQGRVVRFGDDGEVRAEEISTRAGCVPAFCLRIGDEGAAVQLRVPGRHNVANALAAAAAAHAVGVGIEAICAGLGAAESVGNRMRLLQLANGVTVLDDSYNANPVSVAAALRSLAEAAARRRIAVLGDMLELGSEAAAHHRAVGRLVAELGIDVLHLFGDYAHETAAGARGGAGDDQSGPSVRELPAEAVHVATSHAAIAAALADSLAAGDWVLVKGSRGQRMEEVVRLLGAS
jgi:UDP-N-acetylmuramoyl-tripeptide--D-alanyl-D-alanine ligase